MDGFKTIGVVGAGSMGSNMAQMFAEQGFNVSLYDVNDKNVDLAVKNANNANLKGRVTGFNHHKEFTQSLKDDKRKLFVFSITHGLPADDVLKKIRPDLGEGDIILDGGNEFYRTTERRQKELAPMGVTWIGMGVSGGYQAARRGPSLSPGVDKSTITEVMPLLQKFAAKEEKTRNPCVAYIGPRGAGHYVKMVHNGIETAMLSVICEAWQLMHHSLDMTNDEIGDIFEKWNADGKMKNTFLIQIASEICKTKKTKQGDGHGEGIGDSGYVLDDVLDKVVQDDDGSEGTCEWSVKEAADRHVASQTIAAAQFFRVASGERAQRVRVAEALGLPRPGIITGEKKEDMLTLLHQAVYGVFLASYCQGLELIARASKDEEWDVSLGTCINIWRAGCIIQEEYIADMLEPILSGDEQIMNMKLIKEVAEDLKLSYEPIKRIVQIGVDIDAIIPAFAATLDYLKIVGCTSLPTQFMEAQMDFFGAHAYDLPSEGPGKASKGQHHYEWRPA